jgi:hypothetical protein
MLDDFKQGLLQNWRIAINAYPISDECACCRLRGQTVLEPPVGWWLMAGAGLFREKSTAGWLLVAGLL